MGNALVERRDAAVGSPGVHAALRVLELLAADGPLGLSEMAAELGIAKSTLHRVCAVLAARSWAVRTTDGRFDLGIRAMAIGSRTRELPLVAAFHRVAADLLTRHDETVCLAVIDGRESVFVALEETSHPVRLVTNVGTRTPAFASASGRVVLADWRPESIGTEFGGQALVTPTGRRLRGLDELREILDEVRKVGYAEIDSETADGLWAASVPVRNGAAMVIAALTICIPTSRLPEKRREVVLRDLHDAGRRLSDDVAWLPAWNATRPARAGL